jgi:tetratricopeptide (TPR) repeat protein
MGCCYILLGIIESNRGNLDQAISYYRQGLMLKQQHLSPDHLYIPYSHNSLGLALQKRGCLDEALEQFNRTLDLWRPQYESGIHENIAIYFHTIGMIYALQDNYELASNNFSRADEMLCICFSSIHSRTATALKCIGSLYGNTGNIVMVQKIFEKVLDIQRRCLPTTHVDIADTLYFLGTINLFQF